MGPVVAQRVHPALPRARRSLAERAIVRFPPSYRALLRLLDRRDLTPRSRLRQRVVRRRTASAFAAVARGDLEVWLAGYTPDAVHRWSPGFVSLGFPERAAGHRDLFEAMSRWDEVWERWTMTQHFIVDLGDALVLMNRIEGTAGSSGLEVEIDHGAILDLSFGLVERERDFNEWAEAVRASPLDDEVLPWLESLAPGEVRQWRG